MFLKQSARPLMTQSRLSLLRSAHGRSLRPSVMAIAAAIGAPLCSIGVSLSYAQATPPSTSASSSSSSAPAPAPTKLEDIVVIGNPLDAKDVVAPVSVLQGQSLLLKRGSTLGETLDTLPGVSQSWFGPNSSRPVIRGLDGDRVRVLNNLGASFDASSVSVDHNPAIDPLAVERIEVLRGPAALLYGGTAIGGVVNVVDNRIPHSINPGLSGSLETRIGGAARELGNAAVIEYGAGNWAGHIDGFRRDTGDYWVPRETGVGAENGSRVVNSAARSEGGAAGMSYQFGKGHAGVSYSEYRSNYGTVAEPTVRIDMKQKTTAAEANLSNLAGPISGVFARFSHTDYEHVELDEGAPATRFTNRGNDARVEVKHAPIGPLTGMVGLQVDRFTFSALGDEAFVPRTKTRSDALFIFEELKLGTLKLSGGGRVERNRINSGGAVDEDTTRFGEARTRTFTLGSGSVAAQWDFTSQFAFVSNYAYTERAPTYYELFANGPHAATAAYEVGNGSFKREKSHAIDAAIRWKSGESNARIGVFQQSFRNFISLNRTGLLRDEAGDVVTDCGDGTSLESGCTEEWLPEFRYSQVSARLRGVEAEGNFRLIDRPDARPFTLDAQLRADYTRAENRTTGDPLPRIAPLRVGAGLTAAFGAYGAKLDVQHVAKQNRFSREDIIGATAGYTLLNLAGTFEFSGGGRTAGTFFVTGTNLTNRKAFNAASFDTIRGLAPLPGRSLKAGVQLRF
jgi:iron complex outermembrane recepter protein